jgi:23S rRNA (cytosine1962-C5)-methyltransferase
MEHNKFLMFENRLLKVFKHRYKLAERQQISCFRVYDHDLPEFPLMIDKYENYAYIAEYQRNHRMHDDAYDFWIAETIAVVARVLNIEQENIFVKERKRKQNRTDQYQKTAAAQTFLTVQEGGLQFYVNLTDYLDTGLFLDHRITRERIRTISQDAKVLNLFAYTASFSVYAKAGGADLVTSVDISNTYTQWGIRNMQLNNLYDASTEFIKHDVMQWLYNEPKPMYDIIVCDPPTFSNSKSMKQDFFDVQQHHYKLIMQTMKWLRPKGSLFFSTNYTKFQLDERLLEYFHTKDITQATTPFDFEKKLKRFCILMKKIH